VNDIINNHIFLLIYTMAKDKYHYLVKQALIDEGWEITHDPYPLRKWNPDWEIDLGAERMIAAEKGSEKIAIEVKTFLAASFGNEGYPSNVGSFTTAQKSGSKAGTVRTTLLPLFWAVVKLYQHLQP
jgi:hypothetical protein